MELWMLSAPWMGFAYHAATLRNLTGTLLNFMSVTAGTLKAMQEQHVPWW
jgi:hypothetical protein